MVVYQAVIQMNTSANALSLANDQKLGIITRFHLAAHHNN